MCSVGSVTSNALERAGGWVLGGFLSGLVLLKGVGVGVMASLKFSYEAGRAPASS